MHETATAAVRHPHDPVAGALRGRESEFAALERLVAAAKLGQGGIAVVEGVPGIGKSRLIGEALALARQQGLMVAAGRADELDQMTPWGSLLEALASTDPSIVSRAELMSPAGLLDRRLEVLERLRTALERAVGERPLLIAIDDAHWADPSTLLAVGSLAVQLFSYPIVWVLGRRPFPDDVHMRALLERLASQDAVRLPLAPLGCEAVVALAEDLAGSRLGSELQALVAQAQGNPLYVVEIVRSAARRDPGAAAGFAVSGGRISQSPGSVVIEQLRSFPEETRRLVRMASVLGPTFSVVELSAITGRPASELLEPLAETLAAGVFMEEGTQLGFRHDLFRTAVYDDIPLALRLALHREAAAALLAHGAPVLRVANHVAIGATPGDEGAIEALGRAIVDLFSTSPSGAADLALRILELSGPDDPRRPAFVATAVQMLGWAARLSEARALGEAYIADNELPAALVAEIELGIRRAWAVSTSQPYPVPLPEELVADETVPAPVRANLIAFGHHAPTFYRPAEEVREAFRRAEALAEGHGDGTDQVVVQGIHLTLEHEHGRLLDALAVAESPLSGDDDPSDRASCTRDSNIASCLATLGRNREALRLLGRAFPAASSSGSTLIVSRCQSTRAMVLLELGRIDDARAEAGAAADLAESLGFSYYFGQALVTLVEASLRAGDIAEARAAADRLIAWSPHEPTGDAEWSQALCGDAVGRADAVRAALEPIVERLDRGRLVSAAWYPSRLEQLVALALRAGDRDQAAIGARAAIEMSRRNPGVSSAAASMHHARGLLDSNPRLLRKAVELVDEHERPLAAAAAQENLGRMLSSTTNAAAIEQLEAAYEIYVRCGAQRDAARVRAVLRGLGVRKRQATIARPERGWESLTKSERVVAELVARGLTSREAASELFLSVDTINTHLRHAFAKLGIRSRVQLARLAAERERAADPAPSGG